jgi:hypothetical protein
MSGAKNYANYREELSKISMNLSLGNEHIPGTGS